jgi:putative NADH-flavin reductase
MKQNNKIAIIGGTGKSGKYLVKELIDQGFHFKLLIRNPEKFLINYPLIEIVKGDARNYKDILSVITGCYAVISTLGQPKGEPTIFSQATKNIIQAMNECHVKRYIVTSGLNVDSPLDKKALKQNLVPIG